MTARARKYMLNIKSKGYAYKLAFPVDFDFNRKEVPVKAFDFDFKNNTQKCVDWMNENWTDMGPFIFIEDGKIGQVEPINRITIDMGHLQEGPNPERSVATNAQ